MTLFDPTHFPFPMHSIHILHKGKLLQEEYYAPYRRGMLHRMFSVTKSLTSLAVGALICEGRLVPDDRICGFFPEYTPADAPEQLRNMTVRDLLMMRTCHRSTTYKLDASAHWVRSFFITPPDHTPGRIFRYDTSAAHTLAALVAKLSGKGVLDYLREVFLDRIAFSDDAYILKDPFGCEIGGSGLVARPEDLLKLAPVLLAAYRDDPESLPPDLAGCADSLYDRSFWTRYTAYLREAMTCKSPTLHAGKTIDEMQGYGYQFWMLRNGGVMMYGMGGQYLVLYPEAELAFVTTADTQSVQGGTQYILDEIRRVALTLAPELAEKRSAFAVPCETVSPAPETSPEDNVFGIPSGRETGSCNAIGYRRFFGEYRLLPNEKGFRYFSLDDSVLTLKTDNRTFIFPYGLEEPREASESVYGQRIYTRAFPQPDGSLYLRSDILDDYLGCIHILLNGSTDALTILLGKIEESLYSEFNCFLDAERITPTGS